MRTHAGTWFPDFGKYNYLEPFHLVRISPGVVFRTPVQMVVMKMFTALMCPVFAGGAGHRWLKIFPLQAAQRNCALSRKKESSVFFKRDTSASFSPSAHILFFKSRSFPWCLKNHVLNLLPLTLTYLSIAFLKINIGTKFPLGLPSKFRLINGAGALGFCN